MHCTVNHAPILASLQSSTLALSLTSLVFYSLTAWIRLALLSSALVTLLPFCLRPCPWLCSLQPSSGILLTRSSIRYSYNFGYFSRIRSIWQGRFQIGRLGCSLWLPGPRSRSKINQKHGSWSAESYISAGGLGLTSFFMNYFGEACLERDIWHILLPDWRAAVLIHKSKELATKLVASRRVTRPDTDWNVYLIGSRSDSPN